MKSHKTRRRKAYKIRKATKVLLVIIFSLVVLFFSVWRYQYNRYLELVAVRDDLLHRIDVERSIMEDLENQQRLQMTDEYIENIARNELNMIRPNEFIIVEEFDD